MVRKLRLLLDHGSSKLFPCHCIRGEEVTMTARGACVQCGGDVNSGDVVDGDDESLRAESSCQYVEEEREKERMAVQVEEKSRWRKETLFCPKGS